MTVHSAEPRQISHAPDGISRPCRRHTRNSKPRDHIETRVRENGATPEPVYSDDPEREADTLRLCQVGNGENGATSVRRRSWAARLVVPWLQL